MRERPDRVLFIGYEGDNAGRRDGIVDFFAERSSAPTVLVRIRADHPLEVVAETSSDLLVIPVERLCGEVLPVPVIAYGMADLLCVAFLSGCADYLREPWTPPELFFRCRRFLHVNRLVYPWGIISIEPSALVSPFSRTPLSYQEYRLLSLLARHQGEVVSRDALFYTLSGAAAPGSRLVDVHVAAMRKKLASLTPPSVEPAVIRSVRGFGYLIP